MNGKISRRGIMKRPEILIMVLFAVAVLIFPALSGCKKSSAPPATAAKPAEPANPDLQAEAAVQEPPKNDKGYVYDRKDRRDPFMPLIEVKKVEKKDDKKVLGTLVSYDAGDFKVLAIAKKGTRRYALLVAPGNRSFTVYEGTVLGFNNGKVEKITENEVIIIEHIENYLGKIESRQLILELHKGR
ncbi:MAG: pilus assembly protein PilP [Nitrospirae bacterium]|nr:pilus assembly protein PilP [Nitrospirota bacterium]